MIKIGKHYINRFAIEHAIFKRIAPFKKCRSCFRCAEKGTYSTLFSMSVKPKKDAKVRCSSACSPEINGNQYHKACEYYEPRWYWNLGQRLFKARYVLGRWYCENIRMKIGAKREPVPLLWVDGLNAAGELVPRSEPQCPYCGEMPYSLCQCVFCGQRFIKEEENGITET